jgi:hypothetical protein
MECLRPFVEFYEEARKFFQLRLFEIEDLPLYYFGRWDRDWNGKQF